MTDSSQTPAPIPQTTADGQLSEEQLAEVAGGIIIVGGRGTVPRDVTLGGPDTKPEQSQIIGVLIGL
jgi:hypothetical protein